MSSIRLLGLWVMFSFSFFLVQCSVLREKRSAVHPKFPDYSLRYTHPTLCDTGSKQVSGYFELPDGKNFFFWFFESRSNPLQDPVALWINGGPGCSSMLGLFMEIGPCRVDDKGENLIHNPYSWSNNASILYLDQPVNSGYSYQQDKNSSDTLSQGITDSNTAADDVYIFLQLFFKEFSQFANSDFHIAGESYAGHFLPAIANTVYQENSKNEHQAIQLKSVIIGNGLIDPLVQYQYFKPMACEPSTYGTLVSSEEDCDLLDKQQRECIIKIEACYKQNDFTSSSSMKLSADACKIAASACNTDLVITVISSTQQNMYDIRRKCEKGPMCYNYFDSIRTYLNRPKVKEALGVKSDTRFELCSAEINSKFQDTGDWMRPYVNQLIPVLNSGIRVLAYAGDTDYLCNWMGIQAWTRSLPWEGSADYNQQNDVEWRMTTNGTAVGTVKQNYGMTFMRLYNAGHMVPFDQPEVSLAMFNRWISGSI